jgi:hypothetical protein
MGDTDAGGEPASPDVSLREYKIFIITKTRDTQTDTAALVFILSEKQLHNTVITS